MTDYIACQLLRSLRDTLKLPFYTHFQIYPRRNLRWRGRAGKKNECPRLCRCQETRYLTLCSEPLGKTAQFMFTAVTQALLYTKRVWKGDKKKRGGCEGVSTSCFASQRSEGLLLISGGFVRVIIVREQRRGKLKWEIRQTSSLHLTYKGHFSWR